MLSVVIQAIQVVTLLSAVINVNLSNAFLSRVILLSDISIIPLVCCGLSIIELCAAVIYVIR
jgi:hypothetical protein